MENSKSHEISNDKKIGASVNVKEKLESNLVLARRYIADRFREMRFAPFPDEEDCIESIAQKVQGEIDSIEEENRTVLKNMHERIGSIPKERHYERMQVMGEALRDASRVGMKHPHSFEKEVFFRYVWEQYKVDLRVLEDMDLPIERWGRYLRESRYGREEQW